MGRRTVRHRDISRKRRSEKEESIKRKSLVRGDHPTRNGPESFLYCPRLWRSSTGFLNRNSLSQRGYGSYSLPKPSQTGMLLKVGMGGFIGLLCAYSPYHWPQNPWVLYTWIHWSQSRTPGSLTLVSVTTKHTSTLGMQQTFCPW